MGRPDSLPASTRGVQEETRGRNLGAARAGLFTQRRAVARSANLYLGSEKTAAAVRA